MSKHKTNQKLLTMVLSAMMVVGMTPISASAEDAFSIGVSGEIIAFEALGTEISMQGVPLGTTEVGLTLPRALIATVRLKTSNQVSALDYRGFLAKVDSANVEMVSESAINVYESNDAESNLDAHLICKTEIDDRKKDEIVFLHDEEETVDNAEEITVSLSVTWSSTPKYTGKTAGTYLFTPELPEGIAPAIGVEVPTISVTVAAAANIGRVMAFDVLNDDIRWQNTIAPEFPKALDGIVADEVSQIPVTWEADHDYDAEHPARGLYVFTAVLGEGYEIADGVELPRITVYTPQTFSGRMTRVAGGGTTDIPLEITTPAQLAEIAVLVNAGRLETFLFNNGAATVYLKLKNDLDLSGYGTTFNSGKGWKPIGTAVNPFKGHFDGGGNEIVGLYINDASLNGAGLFGAIDGGALTVAVHNVLLSNVYILGASETGGIAGRIQNATVKNCGITGSVMGRMDVGGVAGALYLNSSVGHCYSVGSVISTGMYVGGIAGNLYSGSATVRNCYSTAAVEGNSYVGGIAGYIINAAEMVMDCAALNPSISSTGYKGRVAGQYSVDALSGNVAFKGMTGGSFHSSPTEIDGEDITAAQMKLDGTIGNRFTDANGWTVATGSLPGFGVAADMPAYIVDDSDPNFPGAGTSENPYQISTAAQLAKLSELVRSKDADTRNAYSDKHYKLTADIDLSIYNADNIGFNGGKGWIPIGGYFSSLLRSFSGVFDGSGYTIKGLYLNDDNYYCGGLFGVISNGAVKNLGVADAYIRVGYNVGGISAMMSGTVENCFVTGKISGSNSVGGIIGDFNSSSSTVINCYSAAAVTGVDEVGGIVGRSNMGCVVNSYVTGAVTGASKVGGIVGDFYGVSGSKVQNCVALNPSISGSSKTSRVAGSHGGTGVISGNHAYSGMIVTVGSVVQTITDGTANNINGLSKTADELQATSGFPSGFGSAPWTYTEKMLPGLRGKAVNMPLHLLPTIASPFGGGDGSSEEQAYEISTASQLAKLAELVSSSNEATRNKYNSKYYKLTDDIDLSAYGKSYDGGKGWVPIGRVIDNESLWFNGKFDGNGKVITGLFCNRPDEGRIGLFGYTYEADLKNIAVVRASINGNNTVGGIAGMTSYGTVRRCYVSGTISGERFVGGIVGAHAANNPILKDCHSDAAVSGKNDTIGGIVAWTVGTVENCYATGLVSGGTKVGGIAGDVSYQGKVRNCAALNPGIIAAGDNVGRVAGGNVGALTNNYAFSGMKMNGNAVVGGTAANTNGTNMSIAQANTADFWTTKGKWDSFIWTIADNKLPVLTVFPVGTHSGDGGVYLTGRDIAHAIVGSIESSIYNGSQQIPPLTVTFDGTALVKDADYTIGITSSDGEGTSAGTNAGEVTITITGKGNFKGTKTGVTYIIRPKTLTTDMLTVTGDSFIYTGSPQTPDVTITDGTTLTSGTDYYDITYSDNTNVGEASVSVTGKGNYTGTARKSFIIAKAAAPIITWPTASDVAYSASLSASCLSSGSTGYGSFEWSAPEIIPTVANSGYEVIFTPSTATVNNYEAISPTTTTVPITVTPKNISGFTIDTIGPVTYTGEAQTPTVTVNDGVTELTSGADYDVTYSNNTNAGEASVRVSGKDNYTGTTSKNFTIEKRPVTVKADDKSMTRGNTLPTFTFTVDGQLLGEAALAGVPTLFCKADGKTAGNYPISVDLTGVSYTANYAAATPALENGALTVNNPPSGGDSSSGSDTVTIAPEKQPDQPVTSEVSVTATTGHDGTARASISDKSVTDAIAKAQEEAKKQEKTATGICLDLNVNMLEGTSSLSLTLSQNTLQSLVNSHITSLAINSGFASLGLDLEALKAIQKQGAGNSTITIKPAQNLSGEARAMIGTRPVYDVTVSHIKDGKTVSITSLGGGCATLSFPYTLGRNEAVGYLFGVYVDSKGNAIRIPGSAYETNSGSIILDTNHLSVYGVGYQSSSEKYTDIATHWAKESIDYVIARGLFSGTSNTAFTPDTVMSRGMLVTVLGRLSGADVSGNQQCSFTDVATGKYYASYIEWAYKKGIIKGIGKQQFAPDRAITREEIAVIFANYAEAAGYKLPITREAAAYADADHIGSFYQVAVTAMQQAGIMVGGSSNTFNPKADATRAETSSMLHRYIKLTIEPATAQGWAKNDAGQYLYYNDGKALIGTQTIKGVEYFFNTDGTLKTGWLKDGGRWRFYSGSKLLTGWCNIGSDSSKQTYYFDTYGNMISGKWLQIDGKWYYFYADGSLAKNATIDGHMVDDNGARKNK